jgi:predicted NBD/HSP70 family sugar kinase
MINADEKTPLAQFNPLTLADIAACAEQGDAVAHDIIEQTGYYLGLGLADVINLLNPSYIYLGGSVTQLGPLLLAQTQQTVQAHVLPTHRTVQIECSALGRYAPTVGAATLILRSLFEPPQ